MIGENTFPKKVNYFALAGMKGERYAFPYSNKENQSFIIETVCDWFGTTFTNIKKRSRQRVNVVPRQVCMFLLHRYSDLSLKEIGNLMGGFDHTSVLYAKRLIGDLMDSDDKLRKIVQAIETKIQ